MQEIGTGTLIQILAVVITLLIVATAIGVKVGRRNERRRHEAGETLRSVREMRSETRSSLIDNFGAVREQLRRIENHLEKGPPGSEPGDPDRDLR